MHLIAIVNHSNFSRLGCRHQIFLTMKLLTTFLFVALLQVNAKTFSQNLSVNMRDVNFEKAVKEIAKKTGYQVFYQQGQIKRAKSVNLKMINANLKEVLDELFKMQPLKYEIANKTIVISLKENEKQESQFITIGKDDNLDLGLSEISVKGRIVNEDGNALSDASVKIKNTEKGVVANKDGSFTLANVKEGDILVISYVGYITQEIKVRNEGPYNIVLKFISNTGEEVVINGIFRRTKSEFTGAVTTLSKEQLMRVNPTNLLAAIRSLEPSFQIVQNNLFGSDPNKLPEITVRGQNGFPDLRNEFQVNPNLPLFILDGFEVNLTDVVDIDLNRVASATILKDASAVAVYGSRGANGVLVIETIRPASGKLRVTYDGNYSITAPDLSQYNLLNAREKLDLERNAGFFNSSSSAIANQNAQERYFSRLAEIERGVNTDWISQPVRNSFSQKHSLHLDGGDQAMQYGIDLGYNDIQGAMKSSFRRNLTGGMKLRYRKGKFTFFESFNFNANNAQNSPYGSFSDYARMNPYWRIRDENGNNLLELERVIGSNLVIYNPLYNAQLNSKNTTGYTLLRNNFSAEWNLNSDLQVRGRFSIAQQFNEAEIFVSPRDTRFINFTGADLFRKGSYTETKGKNHIYEGDLALLYSKRKNRNLISGTLGFNASEKGFNSTTVIAEGFSDDRLNDINFASQYQRNGRPAGTYQLSRLAGIYSQLNYSYQDRFILSGSFRLDGSSQFGMNRRFAPFWSTGASWNMQNESFLSNNKWLNRLKLRVSVGETGAQNFSSFQSLTTYTFLAGQQYDNAFGVQAIALGNNQLQWQKTLIKNIGLDLSLFDSRLQITTDFYVKNTSNLLTDVSLPPSTGFESYKENLGAVKNTGIEASLKYVFIKNQATKTFVSFNASIFHNTNRIVRVSNAIKQLNETLARPDPNNPLKLSVPTPRFEEGRSLSAIFAVKSLGIDPATGKELFLTRDGKPTFIWDPNDKVVVGDLQAKIEGLSGISIDLNNFSCNVLLRYRLGGQVYNQTLVNRVENADKNFNTDRRVLLDRWTNPGDLTYFKDVKDNSITLASSRFVQNENTLAFESIQIAYDFAEMPFFKKSKFDRFRLSAYMNDIVRFSTVRQERGLDYPFARQVSMSLQVIF